MKALRIIIIALGLIISIPFLLIGLGGEQPLTGEPLAPGALMIAFIPPFITALLIGFWVAEKFLSPPIKRIGSILFWVIGLLLLAITFLFFAGFKLPFL